MPSGDNEKSKQYLNPVKTSEEAKKRGRNGGIASGVARRKKKELKALAKTILNNNIRDFAQVARIQEELPDLEQQDITWGLVLLLKQFEKAKDGDPKAFEILRDTSGQKPVDQQEIDFTNKDRIEIKIDGDDVE